MITASIEQYNQFETCIELDEIKCLILPIDCFDIKQILKMIDIVKNKNKIPIIKFERISRYNEKLFIKNETIELLNSNINYYLIQNLDCFNFVINNINKNCKIILDWTMNITNSESKKFYIDYINKKNNKININFTQSMELNKYELKQIDYDEYIVYGYIPTMVSANCIYKNTNKCKNDEYSYIIDRKNKKLNFKSYCKYCYNKIYNPDIIYIDDLVYDDNYFYNKMLRYEFTIENKNDIIDIIVNKKKPLNYTRGHFLKSII